MMFKKIYFCLILLSCFLVFGIQKAEAFNLTSVGSSNVTSQTITTLSAVGSKPVFRGTTDPSGAIIVTIDGTGTQVNADSAGSWVLTPTTDLSVGNHIISITDGLNTMNFTLTLSAATQKSLPQTGTTETTVLLFVLGGMMIFVGRKFLI
jgi:hypothetical protein